MNKIIKYIFLLILIFMFFSCEFVQQSKFLSFKNGDFVTKIIIMDNSKNKHEYNVEPKWIHGWSENILGDFKFIYIKNENNLEGIFIISNEYNKKRIPFDIIPKNKLGKMIEEEYENDKIIISYDIFININEDIFEIEYNEIKFNILSYYSYDENFQFYKTKYMNEYNLKI